MTPAERRLWLAYQRFTAGLQPDVQRAYLRAWELIRRSIPEATLARLIATGSPDQVIREILTSELLDRAFSEVRRQLIGAVDQGTVFHARRLSPLLAEATAGVSFNVLNPRVIDAIRAVDLKHIVGRQEDVREVVRAFVENGLRDGVGPRTIARQVKPLIGLGPTQWQEVANFRAALEAGDATKALGYLRRDRRFDGAIKKGGLSREKIDRMVEAYTKRRIALNAETNARTATLDSLKRAQRLTWDEAVAQGIVDRGRLRQRWVTNLDGRERPEHNALNGTVIGYDERWPNGETTPGDSTYNCRCLAVVFQARA
jgi:hypothetical protein